MFEKDIMALSRRLWILTTSVTGIQPNTGPVKLTMELTVHVNETLFQMG